MATSQLASAQCRQPHLRLSGVPVLLYHQLSASRGTEIPPRERKYCLSSRQFHEQLKQLQAEGYRVKLLRELWDFADRVAHGESAVVLTFDDGRESDYRIAYPLLSQAGLRAEFFVNTAAIGQPGFLSWRQMAEMQRSGMSFQSHSHDHVDLSRLAMCSLERQLRDSKRLLEDRLACPVDFLAAPYGRLNRGVQAAALAAGYRAVCNSRHWPAQPGAAMVNRVAVYAHTSARDFRRLLARHPVCYLARILRATALYVPKLVVLRIRPNQLGVRILGEQA